MGMKVKTTVGDDQTKADVARDNAQRMIERDGAVMITGGSSTGTALRRLRAVPAEEHDLHGDAHARRRDDEPELPQAHVPPLQRRVHERAVAREDAGQSKYGTGKWFYITADYAWGHSVYDNITAVIEPKGAKTIKNVLKLRHDGLLADAPAGASREARRARASPSSARTW